MVPSVGVCVFSGTILLNLSLMARVNHKSEHSTVDCSVLYVGTHRDELCDKDMYTHLLQNK